MVAKFLIFAIAITICHSAPFSIVGNNPAFLRRSPTPSVIYPYPHGNSQASSSAVANSGSSYAHGAANTYNSGLHRNYNSAVSSAQNFDNLGSVIASSDATGQGSAIASASNLRGLGYGSTVSSANTNNGFGSAVSSADNSGYGTALSSAQTRGGLGDYSSATSAAQNVGGVRASTSHVVQQSGGTLQHSGATSIDGPGIQSAYSHAVNNGYY